MMNEENRNPELENQMEIFDRAVEAEKESRKDVIEFDSVARKLKKLDERFEQIREEHRQLLKKLNLIASNGGKPSEEDVDRLFYLMGEMKRLNNKSLDTADKAGLIDKEQVRKEERKLEKKVWAEEKAKESGFSLI